MSNMVRIGVLIPEDIRKILKSDAALEGQTMNELVSFFIEEALITRNHHDKAVIQHMFDQCFKCAAKKLLKNYDLLSLDS